VAKLFIGKTGLLHGHGFILIVSFLIYRLLPSLEYIIAKIIPHNSKRIAFSGFIRRLGSEILVNFSSRGDKEFHHPESAGKATYDNAT
jgi:hypothetical protein